jgi:hypothetical protein
LGRAAGRGLRQLENRTLVGKREDPGEVYVALSDEQKPRMVLTLPPPVLPEPR